MNINPNANYINNDFYKSVDWILKAKSTQAVGYLIFIDQMSFDWMYSTG
jgi:hypothetical protein